MLGIILETEDENFESTLYVLDFQAGSGGKQIINEIETGYAFQLPDLDPEVWPSAIIVRSDPSPGWQPARELRTPFYTAGTNRLCVVSLHVQTMEGEYCAVFHIPFCTLLGYVQGEQKALSWEEWGPKGSRMLISPTPGHSPVWVCYVYGSNYVTPGPNGYGSLPCPTIMVYDFNQPALRRKMPEIHDADDLPYSSLLSDVTFDKTLYITAPSVLAANGVFENDVQTSLPYRVRVVPLINYPVHGSAVMCSEDSLILVDVRV